MGIPSIELIPPTEIEARQLIDWLAVPDQRQRHARYLPDDPEITRVAERLANLLPSAQPRNTDDLIGYLRLGRSEVLILDEYLTQTLDPVYADLYRSAQPLLALRERLRDSAEFYRAEDETRARTPGARARSFSAPE